MTGKIKLNAASGGGSVSFQAPSSTGDDRVITLPTSADGTVLTTTNPKAGNIIQVVATNVTASSSVSVPNAGLADTPATVTITSEAANSKFLISGAISGEGTSMEDHSIAFVLRRVIGGSGSSINVGASASNRIQVSFMSNQGYFNDDQSSTPSTNILSPYLDSPSQAAGTAITYKIDITGTGDSGTYYFGRTVSYSDDASHELLPNYITVMEVAV